MIKWASIVSLLITLALEVVRYLQRKEVYDQVRLRTAIELMEKANELVSRAVAARDAVSHNPADVVSDPDNRDNDKPGGRNNVVNLNGKGDQL